MTPKPLGIRVLIKPIKEDAEKQTKSGIIIPSVIKEQIAKAVVLAIGDEVEVLKVGDTILYLKETGMQVKVDDEDCVIIFEKQDGIAII